MVKRIIASLSWRDLDLLDVIEFPDVKGVDALIDPYCRRACTTTGAHRVSCRVWLKDDIFDILNDVFFDFVIVVFWRGSGTPLFALALSLGERWVFADWLAFLLFFDWSRNGLCLHCLWLLNRLRLWLLLWLGLQLFILSSEPSQHLNQQRLILFPGFGSFIELIKT